jgi:UTP--glucose-1-phosphate uridylyltransferase
MEPTLTNNAVSEGTLPDIFASDPRFDADLLRRFDFDATLCLSQMRAVREGTSDELSAQLGDNFEVADGITTVNYDGRSDEQRAHAAGVQALARGEVAVLVLNGGLATRFGGVVKGTVPVFDNFSFLGAKVSDLIRAKSLFGKNIPLLIMNSFATRDETAIHLGTNDYFGTQREDIEFFDQSISIRLTEEGQPFFGTDGQARYYAPGHGEFFQRLHVSGLFAKLTSRGIRYITFSNIDNLGATLDPLLLGLHIVSHRDMTVEVIRKTRNASGAWDVGGAPIKMGGQLQIVEGFRFPDSVPPEKLADFQTNNMYFSLAALGNPPTLPRYLVKKQVEGRESIGFEAITCEASGVLRPNGEAWLSLNLLRVPRDGQRGRFYPIKSREDLELMRPQIRERLFSGWAIREREVGC